MTALSSHGGYKNVCLRDLLADLARVNWLELYVSSDIDFKVKFFTDAMLEAYDDHAPYRSFTPRRPPSPWLTKDIKSLISARNNTWRTYKRRRGAATLARYRYLRNSVKTTIKMAKYNFIKEKLHCCPNTSEMWKIVGQIGLAKSKPKLQLLADLDAFNTHIVGNIGPPALVYAPPIGINNNCHFDFKRIEAPVVLEALASCRSNTLGSDKISLRHLRECTPIILEPLVDIFQTSLRTGYFPKDWKLAMVRPLPKTKPASTLSDFRSISILNATSKVLESVALHQISDFVNESNLLDDLQSGFRKGFSTHTAVVKIVDDLRLAIDRGYITLAIGIDQTRAFDLVNIDCLVSKFRSLGFSEGVCKWTESYLSDRQQIVVFPDGQGSTPLTRIAGVPQDNLRGRCSFLYISTTCYGC